MAKQTTKDVREKKGFVLYADDLVAAEELLPDFERRGQLLSMITAYTTGNKLPQVPDLVRASFVYIRNGINANNAKYERKREKQAEYNQRQREKLERLSELERAKKSQVPQVPQVEQISQTAQSTTNNSINNGNGNGNSNGIDNGNGINNGNGNRHGNSNGSENTVNSISPNTEYLKNNSLSENKYTLDEVREILERERIFLKQNWLRDFFRLNNVHYKWKFDPVSAAQAFIRVHPEAEKKQENTPQCSAAPPTERAGEAYSAMEAKGYQTACGWWNTIYWIIKPKLTQDDDNFLRDHVKPDIGYIKGVSAKVLRFVIDNDKGNFVELCQRTDAIFKQFKETFDKYVTSIEYKSKIPPTTK